MGQPMCKCANDSYELSFAKQYVSRGFCSFNPKIGSTCPSSKLTGSANYAGFSGHTTACPFNSQA